VRHNQWQEQVQAKTAQKNMTIYEVLVISNQLWRRKNRRGQNERSCSNRKTAM